MVQSGFPLILSSLLLGLSCVVALVEHSLYGGWNRRYYTRGLPFVVVRIPAPSSRQQDPPVTMLESQFRSALIGSLVFQPIAPDTYGFRRRFFQSALFPGFLTHGMLRFDRQNGQVVVNGFMSVWVALLALAALSFAASGPFPGLFRLLPLAIFVLVIGVPVLIERRRCVHLARFAAGAWSAPGQQPGSLSSNT